MQVQYHMKSTRNYASSIRYEKYKKIICKFNNTRKYQKIFASSIRYEKYKKIFASSITQESTRKYLQVQ